MLAIKRDIAEAQTELDAATAEYNKLAHKLRTTQRAKGSAEEQLSTHASRLKQIFEELEARRAVDRVPVAVAERLMPAVELERRCETLLVEVLEAKLLEARAASAAGVSRWPAEGGAKGREGAKQVRVEFEQDEVFWHLTDMCTFDMLLHDAARLPRCLRPTRTRIAPPRPGPRPRPRPGCQAAAARG